MIFPNREVQLNVIEDVDLAELPVIEDADIAELCPDPEPEQSSLSPIQPTPSPPPFNSSRPSRPVGGGKGAKGMEISGQRLSKDAQISRKWKEWKVAQSLDIQKELKKNRGQVISCKLCSKKVKTSSYLNHRTLNGCPKMDPCFRLKNFKKKYADELII